ncbi:hypothetical protein PINS_up015451 [Pythium insidiosum]|nr:hypothetical protein PINS_up015451 [Pythium insidiosum]
MKQSLAARQAALLQQNAELDAKVEAIEQRRQQQLLSATGKASSRPSDGADDDDDDGGMDNNAAMERSVAISLALTDTPPRPTGSEPGSVKERASPVASSSPRARLEHRRSGPSVVSGSRSTAKRMATVPRRRSGGNTPSAAAGGASSPSPSPTEAKARRRRQHTAQEEKHKLLESQLATANAKIDELQRVEKQTSQQFRSKDVRLNRALEELEKVKAQLQDERRAHGEHTINKTDFDHVVKENKRLEKQKNELLVAFKKQMKLIDILKRQRIHMEAAKMLSFTEEEFSKTLELG